MQSASNGKPTAPSRLSDLESQLEASLALADEIGAGLAAVYISHALEIVKNELAFPEGLADQL